MKKLFISMIIAGLALPVFAQTKTLLNLERTGLAIQGYDPVSFFTVGKAVKGDAKYVSKRDGAIYHFASKEHLQLFNADPQKYEPSFGGYCAYGVSRKKLVEIDPEAFQIVKGRLFLQYSKDIRDDFTADLDANLAKANANWPVLVAKKGK